MMVKGLVGFGLAWMWGEFWPKNFKPTWPSFRPTNQIYIHKYWTWNESGSIIKIQKKKGTNILALIKGEKINIPKNQRTLCILKN